MSCATFTTAAPTTISTPSLHDALPISYPNVNAKFVGSHGGISIGEDGPSQQSVEDYALACGLTDGWARLQDRKSTRLNSSHVSISYAVFCLKKKSSLKLDSKLPKPILL